MKTIWVVEQGEYSDYRVVGVFTTKENAERVANLVKDGYDKPTVAEWPLDPAINELNAGMGRWLVWMLRDGTTEKWESTDVVPYDLTDTFHVYKRSQSKWERDAGKPDVLIATVWATDAKHAIKIVNEHRTRMIATGEWK